MGTNKKTKSKQLKNNSEEGKVIKLKKENELLRKRIKELEKEIKKQALYEKYYQAYLKDETPYLIEVEKLLGCLNNLAPWTKVKTENMILSDKLSGRYFNGNGVKRLQFYQEFLEPEIQIIRKFRKLPKKRVYENQKEVKFWNFVTAYKIDLKKSGQFISNFLLEKEGFELSAKQINLYKNKIRKS